jgi:hypothetical protein
MRTISLISVSLFSFFIAGITYSDGVAKKAVSPGANAGTSVESPSEKKSSKADTLIVNAKLIEIPGKLPPNDLYNYVYIMKYQILTVQKGTCTDKEILVGQYNPLIARNMVKDKMDQYVNGNVKAFVTGDKHVLKLITPIESVWKDAIEDEYFDSDLPKYYAIQTDMLTK